MDTLEPKNIITKIFFKNSVNRLNSRMEVTEESVNLKTEQYKWLKLNSKLVTLLVLVYKVTKDKATRTESQTQERSQHCRHESTVLGGDSTEVKIWRPKRQGHLGAVLEPRAWERKAALATQFPQCQMLPLGLSFLSTTSSSIIHTHPAVLWLVQAPWVWMFFLCESSRMKLEMTLFLH